MVPAHTLIHLVKLLKYCAQFIEWQGCTRPLSRKTSAQQNHKKKIIQNSEKSSCILRPVFSCQAKPAEKAITTKEN